MNGCSFFGVGCLTWWWSKLVIFHFFTSIPTSGRKWNDFDWYVHLCGSMICLLCFLSSTWCVFFSEEPALRKNLTLCFYWKEPCATRNFLFPANGTNGTQEWRCWKMMFFFKGMIWRFQPPVFGECQRKIPKMMPFEASINWTKKAFLQASPLHFSQGQGLISWYLIGFFPLS